MTETRHPAEERARPRWRWPRLFYQFSLRTLLVVMTLAAVACWWLLRPETLEEELAGKYLTLRRQVRVEPMTIQTHHQVLNDRERP